MDQGVGWQPQAKVPPELLQGVKQLLMKFVSQPGEEVEDALERLRPRAWIEDYDD
jgi:hypothetical protein